MPVRFLSSPVMKWPDRESVERAIRSWVEKEVPKHSELDRVGYYGSYSRGDWGVGSDLDLIAIVDETTLPVERRTLSWDLLALPVQTEMVVYSKGEWLRMLDEGGRFARTIEREVVWVYVRQKENGRGAPRTRDDGE